MLLINHLGFGKYPVLNLIIMDFQIQILYSFKNQVIWYKEHISQLITYTIIYTRWYKLYIHVHVYI